MEFFIGTTNPYKIREFATLMDSTGHKLSTISVEDIEETEPNFEGNAIIKARTYAKYSGGNTISEDSGLVIPYLGGLPGVWSARFSEFSDFDIVNGRVSGYSKKNLAREEIDKNNNELVLQLMRDLEQPRRGAYFIVSLIVVSSDGDILFKKTSTTSGWISDEARGSNGFGYDPIFIGQDTFGKTYGEIDSARKNLRSHRKKVIQEFKMWLGTKERE